MTWKPKFPQILTSIDQNFDYFDLKNQINENFWSQNTKILTILSCKPKL